MRPLSLGLSVTLAALALVVGQALADPPQGEKAGLEALSRGDNDAAVRLFTQVLLYGSPARADRELAYVERAQAFLALGRDSDALADAGRALALNPRDVEAMGIRDKARVRARASPPVARFPGDASDALNAKVKAGLDAVGARNRAAFETYQAQMADYQAKTAAAQADEKAARDAYEASLAARQAQVEALDQQRAAAMTDWEARVRACQGGQRSQCAKAAPTQEKPQ